MSLQALSAFEDNSQEQTQEIKLRPIDDRSCCLKPKEKIMLVSEHITLSYEQIEQLFQE